MKRIYYILIFFIFNMAGYSQATQNVKGTVIDKDSDFPLMGAEVSITKDGKLYGGITDMNGEYIIKNVPVGRINMKAFYTGYEPVGYDNLDLDAGKELIVNFALSESVAQLDEVVIKTSKKKDRVAFVVNSEYELKAEQINRYAGSLNDVSRMAMNYAGVASNDDSQNSIIVRGNNPSSLLWTMEGIAIPNPNHYSASGSSGGPVSMININTLGKSDFLAGAFPANFGNTTSAAFDLQFRTPNKDKYEYVGQIGFAGAEFGIEGYLKKHQSSFFLNYRYSTLELFDKLGMDLGVGTAVPKYHDASLLLNIPTEKAGKFRIWTIAGQSKIRFLIEGDGGRNLYLDYDNSDLSTYNLTTISGINHKYFFNNKTNIFSSISYSHLDQRVILDTLTPQTGRFDNLYKDKILTGYFSLKSELKTKRNAKNTVAIGAEYTLYQLDLSMQLNKIDSYYENTIKNNAGLLGTYLNWKHKFSDKLQINSGLRMQYFNINDEISIEPRLGVKYHFDSKTKFSFAYGLHSNMHQLLAYYAKHEIDNSGQYEYGNLNLGFTKSHHFVAGIERNISNKLNAKIEFYYQYLFNVPVYHQAGSTYSIINAGYSDPGGAQIFFDRLYNDGYGKNYGVDCTLEQPLDKGFYVLFTGSLYRSLYKAYDGVWRNTAWNGTYMSSLLTGKEFDAGKGKLSFNINLNYSGGRRYTPLDKQASIIVGEAVYDENHVFEYQLPAYFRTDVKLVYKISGKHVTQEWQLDFRNIFNRRNVFSQRYNKKTNEVEYTYQTGFLPVMQYRILF